MANVEKNFSLKPYNTFGLDAKAKLFATFESVNELIQLLDEFPKENLFLLGGGSNILFVSENLDNLVLQNKIKGIEISSEDQNSITIKAGAGVPWHELVLHTINQNWGGLENLSLIPGTVGAAPIQNIGAYGTEIKDTFVSLEALDIQSKKIVTFNLESCQFGYRSSIFKNEAKGKYIILSVSFRLSKKPTFTTSYGAISDTLKEMGVNELSVKAISNAVIKIRQSKLPDPKEIGNAGSFFKNPEISISHFEKLKQEFQDIPSYPIDQYKVKVPAGWLIEKCGWKGKRLGDTGVHKNQALVLVNYGNAKGIEIKNLSIQIQESVATKFNISLETEVNFL